MATFTTNPPIKNYQITPLIETELIQVGYLKLIRATVTVGTMTVTSFSDAIRDSADLHFDQYIRQATYRAMELILRQ